MPSDVGLIRLYFSSKRLLSLLRLLEDFSNHPVQLVDRRRRKLKLLGGPLSQNP